MRKVISVALGGPHDYVLHIWERISQHGRILYGKTKLYVLVPFSQYEAAMEETDAELAETIRDHGAGIAKRFERYNPGKVGQVTIHLDRKWGWVSACKINLEGNLDLSLIKTLL